MFDAFTERPFAGNPAAVCLLPIWKENGWLQAVAREMNLIRDGRSLSSSQIISTCAGSPPTV